MVEDSYRVCIGFGIICRQYCTSTCAGRRSVSVKIAATDGGGVDGLIEGEWRLMGTDRGGGVSRVKVSANRRK